MSVTTFQAAGIFRRRQSLPVENVALAYAKLVAAQKGDRGEAATLIRQRLASARQPGPYRAAFLRWQRRTPPGDAARRVLRFKAAAPVLCGLGEPTPLENGLSLQHTFGTPLLPGSSLKGVTRAWMRGWYAGDETWGEGSPAFRTLFGAGGHDGEAAAVDFLDAWMEPTVEHPFTAEILTPHQASYYQGKEAPDGLDGPIPVTFLAVDKGVTFRVVLEGDPGWLDAAVEALTQALAEQGVGAKTRAGYGRLLPLGQLDGVDQGAQEALRTARLPAAPPDEQLDMLATGRSAQDMVGHLKDWMQEKAPRDPLFGHLRRDEQTQRAVAGWLRARDVLGAWRKGSRAEKELRRLALGWLGDAPAAAAPAPAEAKPTPASGRFGDRALSPADTAPLPKNRKKQGKERNARVKRLVRGGYSEAAVLEFLEFLAASGAPVGARNEVRRAYGMDLIEK